MKLYFEYYYKLFILWFKTYFLKKHNLKCVKEKKLYFSYNIYISTFLYSCSISIIICFFITLLITKLNIIHASDGVSDVLYIVVNIWIAICFYCTLMFNKKRNKLYCFNYSNNLYGLRNKLLNNAKFVWTTHNKINDQIKIYNEEYLKSYKKRIKDYYLDEKSQILHPKEKKEILDYFKC